MSLADLIPALLVTRKERNRISDGLTKHRRWQLKNREHLRAYKREWDRKRKLMKAKQ